MQRYAIIDKSGRIQMMSSSGATRNGLRAVPCSDEISDDTHYYDIETSSFIKKMDLDTSYIVNGLSVVFNKVPLGVLLYCDGFSIVSDEGGIEIEFDFPGSHKFFFMQNRLYKNERLEIQVG